MVDVKCPCPLLWECLRRGCAVSASFSSSSSLSLSLSLFLLILFNYFTHIQKKEEKKEEKRENKNELSKPISYGQLCRSQQLLPTTQLQPFYQPFPPFPSHLSNPITNSTTNPHPIFFLLSDDSRWPVAVQTALPSLAVALSLCHC